MSEPKKIAMVQTERDLDVDRAYRIGTIVGAAIVAWGDAMREREEGKRRAKDLEALMLEEDMG